MKSTFKTLQTQVLHLIRGAVIILISAREGAAQFMTQEQSHAQYGQMVREMQTEAAAILSDAPSYLDVSKSCPSAQVDTSQSDQSQGDLRIFVSFSMSEGALKSLELLSKVVYERLSSALL